MIKYLVMDVDGTLTDGKIYMSSDGELFKVFDIKDGYGIHELLNQHSIVPVIITGRESKIVENRSRELGIINIFQGVNNKYECLSDFLKKKESGLEEVAYLGDDIGDYKCMSEIKDHGGITGSPADAVEDIKLVSCHVSPYKGGRGAVREFIEWIIRLDQS